MTVKQLIEKLLFCPQDAVVLVFDAEEYGNFKQLQPEDVQVKKVEGFFYKQDAWSSEWVISDKEAVVLE